MSGGGGDVHLLHVTPTPSTGRHPSRAIVQLCFVVVRLRLSSRGRTARPTRIFKVLLVTGMPFLHP
jgi:hypothetical protein